MTKADKQRFETLEGRAAMAEHEVRRLKEELAKCNAEKQQAHNNAWRAETNRDEEIKFLRSAVNAALGVKAEQSP